MAELAVPVDAEAGVSVESLVPPFEHLVEDVIDQCQRRPDCHPRAVGLDHPGIAGVDRHPRPDRRLPQIDRRDVGLEQSRQLLFQFFSLGRRGDGT
jgi:hypothetical protein